MYLQEWSWLPINFWRSVISEFPHPVQDFSTCRAAIVGTFVFVALIACNALDTAKSGLFTGIIITELIARLEPQWVIALNAALVILLLISGVQATAVGALDEPLSLLGF